MEENHLHCRTDVNGAESNRKVALITGITGDNKSFFYIKKMHDQLFIIQVRMDLTWQSFSLIKATLFMESSGGRLHSTLAGYLISMMTPSLTDKAR